MGNQKKCRKAYFNALYEENEDRREKIKESSRKKRRENARRVLEYLKQHPCVDCGENNPVVLEFDHVTGEKKASVSSLAHSASKWETIPKEIEKCEVRCVNCHRIQTEKRAGGWYKYAQGI